MEIKIKNLQKNQSLKKNSQLYFLVENSLMEKLKRESKEQKVWVNIVEEN